MLTGRKSPDTNTTWRNWDNVSSIPTDVKEVKTRTRCPAFLPTLKDQPTTRFYYDFVVNSDESELINVSVGART
ncbi:hypothetical protein ACFX12_018870 [Malus domestica]